MDIFIIMNPNKVAVIFSSERYTSGSMCFITNHKVKLQTRFLLKIMNNVNALICREEQL